MDHYDWSFCQIQFNYLDEDFQAGLDGLNYAAGKDMGIVIMEPLSGMNAMQQIKENIEVAEQTHPDSMTGEEINIIDEAKEILKSRIKVNGTACKYCLPCPVGVNIPGCFTTYNSYHMFGKEENYIKMMPEDQRASQCIECGQCEEHCPQSIAIREELKKVKELFGS